MCEADERELDAVGEALEELPDECCEEAGVVCDEEAASCAVEYGKDETDGEIVYAAGEQRERGRDSGGVGLAGEFLDEFGV